MNITNKVINKSYYMTKITKSGKQFKISIPKEIMQFTGWDDNTELILFPYIREPDEEVTTETPIMIKKIKQNNQKK